MLADTRSDMSLSKYNETSISYYKKVTDLL